MCPPMGDGAKSQMSTVAKRSDVTHTWHWAWPDAEGYLRAVENFQFLPARFAHLKDHVAAWQALSAAFGTD